MKKQTIFIDRDGVVNKRRFNDWVKSWGEFEFLPEAIEGLQLLTKAGFQLILITNQRGIATGAMLEEELLKIHQKMQNVLKENHSGFEAIYFCPHQRDSCECRKPKPGLFYKAAKDFDLDLAECAMIGDSETDRQAAETAGCTTFYKVDEKRSLLDCCKLLTTQNI